MDLLTRLMALEKRLMILETKGQRSGFMATAGEALAQGNIVCIRQAGGANLTVYKAPIAGNEQDMPVGFALAAAAIGEQVFIVTSGVALGLPEPGVTATLGYVAYVSSGTAGTVTQAASVGAAQHWRECGHWLENGSGAGVAARIVVHFN